MKIGILVPTRERMNLKLSLIASIITSVKDINNVTLYFGVDDDDPCKHFTQKLADAIPFITIVPIHNEGKFIGINKIWNILADHCKEDIFGYIGDDMLFRSPDWDLRILTEFQQIQDGDVKLVHCNDTHHGSKLSVNAFVNRRYYEVMGYFCRPEFPINYSDSWMYQMFNAFGRVTYIDDIVIQHNHWVFGGHDKDNTANRMLGGNNERIADGLWTTLRQEHKNDIIKLGQYLKQEPDWSKVDL